MTRKLLYEEIASDNPNIYSYSQFNRYYNKFVKTINPSMRHIHYGGDKLFIDYSGLTMPIINQKTGKISKGITCSHSTTFALGLLFQKLKKSHFLK